MNKKNCSEPKHIWSPTSRGFILVIMMLCLLYYISISEENRLAHQQVSQLARSIEIGADLYEINCRNCHGSRGEGVGQLGPAISNKLFFTTRLIEIGWLDTLWTFIRSSMANGRFMATRPMYAGDGITAVMPPWLIDYGGPLRWDQINNITDFVLNWEATALGKTMLQELEIPKLSVNNPKLIRNGQAEFNNQCATCHHIQGSGKIEKRGPDLSLIARTAQNRKPGMSSEEYIRESLLLPETYIVEGYDPQILGYSCGGIMSMTQFEEIVAFLLSRN